MKKTERQLENAKKAKEAADREFPGEKWILIEDGIFLSPRRPIGKRSSFQNELRDAQIFRDFEGTVYLSPEARKDPKKKYDAIVNGMLIEFKNMSGASTMTLKDHFLDSREQAPNVFINLEYSPLSQKKIYNTLYRARNSDDYLVKSKNHKGGLVVLKINGHDRLVYLNIDDLEIKKPGA